MWSIVGRIAVVLIAAAIVLLAVVWLAVHRSAADQDAPRAVASGVAADVLIGGSLLALCALGAWVGRLSGMW